MLIKKKLRILKNVYETFDELKKVSINLTNKNRFVFRFVSNILKNMNFFDPHLKMEIKKNFRIFKNIYEKFDKLKKVLINLTNNNRFVLRFDFQNFQNITLLVITTNANNNNSIWELIMKFYKIWPPFQWATSLLTLILIYWVTGYYYNKFLSKRSGWMGVKARISMIAFDLILNFALGIYYMNYRDTFLGTLMVQCPVFCSPLFWLLELICFYIYYRYEGIWKKKK